MDENQEAYMLGYRKGFRHAIKLAEVLIPPSQRESFRLKMEAGLDVTMEVLNGQIKNT